MAYRYDLLLKNGLVVDPTTQRKESWIWLSEAARS